MTYPSRLLTIGITPESTFGVPAAIPARGLPLSTFAPTDKIALIPDTSWRSSVGSSSGHALGTVEGTILVGGPVYGDSIGYPLAGVLGDLQCIGHGAPYMWLLSALNTGDQQPHSYMLTFDDPVGQVSYPGGRFTSVVLTGAADTFLTWTGQLASLSGVSTSFPQPRFDAVPAMPTWAAAITLGSLETRVEQFTLTFTRTVTAKRNTNLTPQPYNQRAGLLTVSGTATVIASTGAYRKQLLTAAPMTVMLDLQQGVGSQTTRLNVRSSSAVLTAAPREYGKQWIELALTWTADQNDSDVGLSGGLSPALVTLRNALPAGSY